MQRLLLTEGSVRDLTVIDRFVDEQGTHCGLDERRLFHVRMAVDEACANIFEHGYAGAGRTGRLEIVMGCQQDELLIRIYDWGATFNPATIAPFDPLLPLEARPIGGLGIHLIQKLMDGVEYRFDVGGNCLTLRKRVRG